MEAKVPVGVVATEITLASAMLTLPRYLASGGAVFVDSGAFTSFHTNEPPDFERVLLKYECIADTADLSSADLQRLFVVSPDAVGNQMETLNLLQQYRSRLLDLVDLGCQLIVPIQCGEMPASAMLDAVKEVLGTDRFVAGIPSCKAAMSIQECATLTHHSFHILGRVQMDDTQDDRIAALRCGNANAAITADANWLRSRMASVCRMKDDIDGDRREMQLTSSERFRLESARTMAVAAAIAEDQRWAVSPAYADPEDNEDSQADVMSM